jgi:hypothetical protein
MPQSILARVKTLLPRVAAAHDQAVPQPYHALTLYDAYEWWNGATAFTQPKTAPRGCCDLRRDHSRWR